MDQLLQVLLLLSSVVAIVFGAYQKIVGDKAEAQRTNILKALAGVATVIETLPMEEEKRSMIKKSVQAVSRGIGTEVDVMKPLVDLVSSVKGENVSEAEVVHLVTSRFNQR
jgi:hypothetical protein